MNPTIHPFEQGREYVRALNTVKLERMFAKPFVGALGGHIDGVYSMAKHPTRLASMISGSGDGGKFLVLLLLLYKIECVLFKSKPHDTKTYIYIQTFFFTLQYNIIKYYRNSSMGYHRSKNYMEGKCA